MYPVAGSLSLHTVDPHSSADLLVQTVGIPTQEYWERVSMQHAAGGDWHATLVHTWEQGAEYCSDSGAHVGISAEYFCTTVTDSYQCRTQAG